MTIIWKALERAKDTQDEFIIAACRRLIVADRRGWRTHANPKDYRLILEIAE
jgi:hypothetical protein